MNEEFDYDLTPSQWETLKALRTPASRLPRMSRYTIDGLIALELAVMAGASPFITASSSAIRPSTVVRLMRGSREAGVRNAFNASHWDGVSS